ncbi:hypothetical protein J6590_067723 [Homalodisca vitripennis]|nr:hypothetical protein J6590_067723 [Homalodisca vitripennis]
MDKREDKQRPGSQKVRYLLVRFVFPLSCYGELLHVVVFVGTGHQYFAGSERFTINSSGKPVAQAALVHLATHKECADGIGCSVCWDWTSILRRIERFTINSSGKPVAQAALVHLATHKECADGIGCSVCWDWTSILRRSEERFTINSSGKPVAQAALVHLATHKECADGIGCSVCWDWTSILRRIRGAIYN